MIMKFIAAAALSVVSAADVPLFSSNDDYDEINLNIRMLSNATSAAASTTVSAAVKVVSTFPDIGGQTATPALLFASVPFKTGCKNVLEATTALTGSVVTITGVTDASRRARARALSTTPLTIAIAYDAVFATSAAADAAVTAIASTAAATTGGFNDDFANAFVAKLNEQGLTVTVPTVTSQGGSVQTGAAAAAPSPSPSSNAAKVAVSTLAAFAAFMASLL